MKFTSHIAMALWSGRLNTPLEAVTTLTMWLASLGSVQPSVDSSDTDGPALGCIHVTRAPPPPQSLPTALDPEI